MVKQPIQEWCTLLCFNVSKCVGFNFRIKLNEINCQLTNTTKKRKHIEEGEWTLFLDVDAVGLKLKRILPRKIISCSECLLYNFFGRIVVTLFLVKIFSFI